MARVTGADVKAFVCRHYGLTKEEIESPARERRVSLPRMVAYKLTREICPHLSFPAIGRLYNRDHTTIIDGIERLENRAELLRQYQDLSSSFIGAKRLDLAFRAADIRAQIDRLNGELAEIEREMNG